MNDISALNFSLAYLFCIRVTGLWQNLVDPWQHMEPPQLLLSDVVTPLLQSDAVLVPMAQTVPKHGDSSSEMVHQLHDV